jgi:mannose-6-phosphate isomerase-like protein (cupin superfamily)
MTAANDPSETYVHFGEGPDVTTIEVTPDFWSTIDDRTDLHRGRMLTSFDHADDWSVWEMHPNGDELVMMTSGAARLHLNDGTAVEVVELSAPNYVMVPKGVWHTADSIEPGRMLVITWGEGTTHRPRACTS